MLWNDLTTDMLIMVYIAGLFVLILVCMYALIQSKANKLYTFIIIPLALLMASMTWQGIKMLQGMPIYGLPWEEKIEVLYVQDTKPWIFVLVKEEDGPKLYKIDWTEENKKKMKEIQKQIGSSNAQGQFKLKGNKGESQSLFFLPMGDASEPDEKGRQDEGVTFTTTRSTPSAYVDGQGLQLDVHDGGVEFVRERITEVP
tara:strand:+ start:20 stop:619 length:600 start_codon:yes stop_codon:yes gene_type:complete